MLPNTMLKWHNSKTGFIICKMEPMGCMANIVVTLVTFVLGPSQVYAWFNVIYFKGWLACGHQFYAQQNLMPYSMIWNAWKGSMIFVEFTCSWSALLKKILGVRNWWIRNTITKGVPIRQVISLNYEWIHL